MHRASIRRACGFLSLGALLTMVLWSTPVCAVPITSTTSSGTWNDNGNWSAGAPTTGDSAGIGHSMTVTVSDAFGDNTNPFEPSLVTGGTILLTVNSGQTLTHVADSILHKTSSDLQLGGSGTFANAGTFEFRENRIIYTGTNFTLENSGIFEFKSGTNRHVYMNANGVQFVNAAGGQVRVNLPNSTDYAKIMGPTSINGVFVQQAGAQAVDWANGALIFAPPGGTGGVIDDTEFAAMFGASPNPIPATSALQLAGGVQLDLTAATDLTRVRLGSSIDAVNQGASIKVTQGIRLGNLYDVSPSVVSLFNTQGGVITNEVGGTIIKDAGIDMQIGGTGTFDNKGVLQVHTHRILFTGGVTFNNSGVLEFLEDGSHTYFNAANSQIVNQAGGQLRVNLPTATSLARIMGPISVNGKFIHQPGALAVDWQQGVLEFAPAGGIDATLTDAQFASMFGTSPNPIPVNAGLQIGGAIDIQLTSATDLTRVRLGTPFTADPFLGTPAGITIDAPDGIRVGNLVGGTLAAFNTGSSGSTITNLAGSTIIKDSGTDMQVAGSGTFVNDGDFILNAHRILLNAGNLTFENNGLLDAVENTAHVHVNSATAVFRNNPGGLVRIDLPLGTDTAPFTGATNGTFDNLGTVEILRGELDLSNALIVPQVTGVGTSLDGGTWRVLADAAVSRLDLRASGTSAGSIVSIGSGATLVLSEQNGGTMEFPQLGSISTLDGTLYAHGSVDLLVGASPMNVSGTLGGDGTYTAADQIVFSGGTLDPAALDGSGGTLSITGDVILSDSTILAFALDSPGEGGLNDLVNIDGDLTLDGVLEVTALSGLENGVYRLFNYTGAFSNLFVQTQNPNYFIDTSITGQVNLLVVPEPSTAALIGLGTCAWIAARRRRRRR